MAWAWQAHRGSANNKTSSTSIGVSPSAVIQVNDLLLVRVASDNLATVDGESNDHTSVTDNKGNSYTKLREHTKASGGAAAGVTVSMFMSKITTQLEVADTVTVNFSAAIAA